MFRKSFTFATFVRHLLTSISAHFYLSFMHYLNEQIAIGKGFSKHMPACYFL